MNKYYTGVGSRKTPQKILFYMTELAKRLGEKGYILRSGGAEGADIAFEYGADNKNIYYACDATKEAMKIAKEIHPAWERCSPYVRKLHARNIMQVLGDDLSTPSKFLICWTPDGCINEETRTRQTGGTATAIVLASKHKIPVINLKREKHLKKILTFLYSIAI